MTPALLQRMSIRPKDGDGLLGGTAAVLGGTHIAFFEESPAGALGDGADRGLAFFADRYRESSTAAPISERRSAMPRPMPEPAPVTMATLPSSESRRVAVSEIVVMFVLVVEGSMMP